MNNPDGRLDFILIHGYSLTPQGNMRPLLRQRLDDGLALYLSGAADCLIVAGRYGVEDKEFVEQSGTTQADLMSEFLQNAGIERWGIIREREGTTTWDCTKRVLQDIIPAHGFKRGGYVISNREHLPRITLQTEKLLSMYDGKIPPFDIRFAGSPIADPAERTEFLKHEKEALLYTLSRAD